MSDRMAIDFRMRWLGKRQSKALDCKRKCNERGATPLHALTSKTPTGPNCLQRRDFCDATIRGVTAPLALVMKGPRFESGLRLEPSEVASRHGVRRSDLDAPLARADRLHDRARQRVRAAVRGVRGRRALHVLRDVGE